MPISTEDQLLAAFLRGQRQFFTKASATTVAGAILSMFGLAGSPPLGAKQGSLNGAIPDYTTVGALGQRLPGSGFTQYLGKVALVGGANGGLLDFYDRVWHNSEVVCNITTDQLISQPALTRSTDGIGLEIWAEAWTAWGAAGTTFTVTYTNTDGTAGRIATYPWPAGAPFVGQCFRFTLQAGDKGVLSIQKISLTPSTGAAGNLGLFLAKPISTLGFEATKGLNLDAYQLALGQISSGACIAAMLGCPATTSGQLIASITFPEG